MGKASSKETWSAVPRLRNRECPDWGAPFPVGEFVYKEGRPVYVENQVIVTGREGQVNEVVQAVLGPEPQQQEDRLARRVDLDWLPDEALRRFPDAQAGAVVVEAVDTRGNPAEEVARGIHENASGRPSPFAVFADLNFVTGHPHIVAGSPLGQAEATKEPFEDQWALDTAPPGIGLTGLGRALNIPGAKGQGVKVGVFDTSPFEQEGVWDLPWVSPKLMTLCVSHLLSPAPSQTKTSDHGLFVAGLIHVVASQSDIHLIQVLNEDALGDLNTLNRALHLFIRERWEERRGSGDPRPLTKTVVNLSLGFPQPRRPADLGLEQLHESYLRLVERLAADRGIQSLRSYEDDELPVVSLETILTSAEARGVTVVAATGNESTPEVALPPEVPAAYPSVIGVAASNKGGQRACFSNRGDVAAPGGDSDRKGGVCARSLTDISEYGLIGPVLNTSATGYAYWVGTSFAAPLVSGLAARILGKGGPPGHVRDKLKFNKVAPVDPNLGEGIIDVLKSLTT